MESIGGKNWTLYIGDCRVAMREQISPKSVHCITSSPPYWGLRDYGIPPVSWNNGDNCVYGLEKSIAGYIEHTLELFEDFDRVLRDDGIIFWNVGDSYAGGGGYSPDSPSNLSGSKQSTNQGSVSASKKSLTQSNGNKLLIPHRVAIALQDAGWCIRQDNVWAKRSPMPESVSGWRWRRCRIKVEAAKRPRQCMHHSEGREVSTPISSQPHTVWEPCPGCDKCRETGGYVLRRGTWRPTNSHEFIFQIVKSDCYFADGDAVAETATGGVPGNRTHKQKTAYDAGDRMHRRAAGLCEMGASEKRNPRSVHPSEWTAEDIEWAVRFMNATPKDGSVWTLSNEPFKGAHFATFPTSIPRRCITAATSAGGCCPACGSQYAPVVESSRVATRPGVDSKCYKHQDGADPTSETLGWDQPNVIGNRDPKRHSTVNTIQGYRATCHCNAGDPVPPTVFDPFNGSGTTGQVALHLGCRYIGCEINPKYAREIAAIRIEAPLRQQGSPPPKKPAKFQTPSLFK